VCTGFDLIGTHVDVSSTDTSQLTYVEVQRVIGWTPQSVHTRRKLRRLSAVIDNTTSHRNMNIEKYKLCYLQYCSA